MRDGVHLAADIWRPSDLARAAVLISRTPYGRSAMAAGRRLCVQVSSSSFTAWEPNPNTGAPIAVDKDADLRVAHQRVFHDALHPNRVILPIIPRPDLESVPEQPSRPVDED
jgi:predicted acyl esterase